MSTTTSTEWAVRYQWADSVEIRPAPEELAHGWAQYANESPLDVTASVVQRTVTVTYGDWEAAV